MSRRRNALRVVVFAILVTVGSSSETLAKSPNSSRIKGLLKPEIYQKLDKENEIPVDANLGAADPNGIRNYQFYAAASVRASAKRCKQVLTYYPLFKELVPFVHETEFDPKNNRLWLKGGVLGYVLKSQIQFNDVSETETHFRFVAGHFTGLTGRVLFEEIAPRRSLIYVEGSHRSKEWPPAFIVESGAEIVLGVTAQRMRSSMESERQFNHENIQKISQEKTGKETIGKEKTNEKSAQASGQKSQENSSEKNNTETFPKPTRVYAPQSP